MTKQEFDQQLKKDSVENKFKIEADFIIFDSKSNLEYQIIPFFKLKHLLTKNPLSSYTKLSKGLILWLHRLRTKFNAPLYCNSGYRSPEYNLTIPKSAKDSWHTKGMAMDIGSSDPSKLKELAEQEKFVGELGLYDSFIHIAPNVGENTRWDSRKKKSLQNYLDSDEKRNYTIYAIIALILFFLFRKR